MEQGYARQRAIQAGTWAPSKEHWDTPKASVLPTREDIRWGAAFMEGEGSFRPCGVGGILVGAVQKQRWPLDEMAKYFGGKIQRFKHHDTDRPYYRWNITGARARGFAMTIYAFMSPRRKRQIRGTLLGIRNHRKDRAGR